MLRIINGTECSESAAGKRRGTWTSENVGMPGGKMPSSIHDSKGREATLPTDAHIESAG
jgi:hypothetical protein